MFKLLKTILLGLIFSGSLYAQTIPYSIGRIAISSDGNEHDHDDWAATPFSLALLASQGLQDNLVLYTYADHVWGSNHDHSDGLAQMRKSALEGKTQFGFTKTKFIEAVSYPDSAYNALTSEINKSTASNPLTIVTAGPMEVLGVALNKADQTKLKFVRILSHSTWNDNHADKPSSWEHHSGWKLSEITSKFSSKGLKVSHIVDQNGGTGYDGMRADRRKFDWIKSSSARNNKAYKAGSWDWLYTRQETCIKKPNSSSTIREFDPSDAGLIIYLLTGKEKTNPSDAQFLMEHPKGSDVVITPTPDPIPDQVNPSSISDLQLTMNGCPTVLLTWTDINGESAYRVRRKLSSESTYTNIADVPANTTSYVDVSTASGKTYIYMVRPLVNGTAISVSNTPSINTNCKTNVREIEDIIVNPNPFQDEFGFQLNDELISLEGELVDTKGSVTSIKIIQDSEHTYKVSTVDLPQGIYYLRINTNQGIKVVRMLKM